MIPDWLKFAGQLSFLSISKRARQNEYNSVRQLKQVVRIIKIAIATQLLHLWHVYLTIALPERVEVNASVCVMVTIT